MAAWTCYLRIRSFLFLSAATKMFFLCFSRSHFCSVARVPCHPVNFNQPFLVPIGECYPEIIFNSGYQLFHRDSFSWGEISDRRECVSLPFCFKAGCLDNAESPVEGEPSKLRSQQLTIAPDLFQAAKEGEVFVG